MKQLILLFALSIVIESHAQSGDSIRINRSSLPETFVDSLHIKKSDNDILHSPFMTEDNNPLFLSPGNNEERTVEFNLPDKKRTFLNSSYSRFIIPAVLISYGVIARGNESLLNLDYSTSHEINEHLSKPIPYDDYTQYTSYVAIYALGWLGTKAKHNFRDRTLILATSYLIMGTTVQTMKRAYGVKRPDGSNLHSFPSGHTATSFLGAHILFKEYFDVSPWIGVAGYSIATATGVMRVLNQKHWVSDVVSGAGLGILTAEVGYRLLPVWHNILGIKDKNKALVIVPIINTGSTGLGLAYTF